uniref:Protein translocase subunit SecA n=1 Tax=Rhodochaete parvula TaxID=110510 RepID=A0A1X9PV53_9RHOD|nr:preprotein translocase subunit secA [Rhodochaete parvula]ASK39550.1 preprotein translocase subunit SecA [Rhodochaete parvula]
MFNNIFKDKSQRKLEKYFPLIKQIYHSKNQLKSLSSSELQQKTIELKKKIFNGKSTNSLIVESFALVKEATQRVLGLEMYDVQLIAGIVLQNGQIAEMKTGEGKTLAAALPAYLNALKGKGVHIITVNDYLAARDANFIGQIYKFLGLSVGLIQENMNLETRKKNYACDITYVTNSEVAFDYLRDNMALLESDIVHRPFYYAIVDEVDSIFIDEARTPLIIGGKAEASTEKYNMATEISKKLNINKDYEVDYKKRNVILTEQGITTTEKCLGNINIYDIQEPWAPYIMNCLKAKELYELGTQYLIINNEIIIVDEFTGRATPGRRWSEGLHQAIEAKESLKIQKEMKTLASITYQNFFLLYPKLCGMTGTAKTEDNEFEKIYKLEVVVIPTNKKMIRQDFPDLLYKNQYFKWKAVVLECKKIFTKGQPILIGTTSISNSQLVSYLLNECNIPHNILNAKPKNAIREAEIIAQAGRKRAVTIATNMAGRGTDIILGGNATELTKSSLFKIFKSRFKINTKTIKSNLTETLEYYDKLKETEQYPIDQLTLNWTKILLNSSHINLNELTFKQYLNNYKNSENFINTIELELLYENILNNYETIVAKEKIEIIKLGGLHIIGTERHDSRRIDNQLRGRAGRQGDPGSSRFFISLDDKLLKNFGGSRIANIMESLQIEEDVPIESQLLTNFLETAQQKVESYYYDIRKYVFDYDQVLSDHRKAIYAERKRILETDNLRSHILGYAEITINELIVKYWTNTETEQYEKLKEITEVTCKLLNIKNQFYINDLQKMSVIQLKSLFQEQIYISYDLKEAFLESIQPGLTRQLEKYILLTQIDECWTEHLQKMNSLQEIISWRSYGQNDPLIEYKRESFILFCKLLQTLFNSVIYIIMRIEELQ